MNKFNKENEEINLGYITFRKYRCFAVVYYYDIIMGCYCFEIMFLLIMLVTQL